MSDRNRGFEKDGEAALLAEALMKALRNDAVTVSVTLEKGRVDPVIRCNVSDQTVQSILVPVTLARALEESILLTLPHVDRGREHHFVNGLVATIQEHMCDNVDKYLASKEADGK